MIIGNGLIANAFSHYTNNDDFIFFTSGVSNSASENKTYFEREIELLKKTLIEKKKNQTLIYFSSFNIFDSSLATNLYVIHKKNIEFLLSKIDNTVVIRLPIVLAKSKNPNTLINFFVNNIKNKNELTIYKNAWRYIISIEDTVKMTEAILREKNTLKKTYNISYPYPIEVTQLVKLIESNLNNKCKCNEIDKGTFYKADEIFYNFNLQEIKFESTADYFLHYLKKYF